MRDEELLTQLRAQAAAQKPVAEAARFRALTYPPRQQWEFRLRRAARGVRQTLAKAKGEVRHAGAALYWRIMGEERRYPEGEDRVFSPLYDGTAPRVFQLLPSLQPGDAVSNDARALHALLRQAGWHSRIYARNMPGHFQKSVGYMIWDKLPPIRERDIVLYHLSTGDPLTGQLAAAPGHKAIVYHNITPPDFFAPFDREAYQRGVDGYRQARALAPHIEYGLPVSEYDAQGLRELGYTCPIDVVPILIPFEDYRQEPDAAVLKKYQDGRTNILFVGRIAPNKRQEDVVRAFHYYKSTYDPTARLFLVGGHAREDRYSYSLERYCAALGVQDVIFPGHISFAEILAYYRAADLFLCMSDHEGFCVPLVEAMCFDLPIVAKDTTAVGDTLGGAGLLLPDADPALAAAAMERVLRDSELQARFAAGRRAQLERFSYARVSEDFKGSFERFLRQIGAEG